MMRFLHNETRRGATIPLFALLLVPLLGMLAFSIDIGYIAWVRTGLQTTADAAALAGAEQLQYLYVQYTLPRQTQQNAILTTATTNTPGSPMDTAEKFASYNKAGNVPITVRDQDVTFRYIGGDDDDTGSFPNSITVTTRRDSLENSPVSLFVGPIFGFQSKELTATATATIYSGDVTSLQPIPGVKAHVLPVALDVNIWQSFYQTGQSPDGLVHLAANGYPQLQVYPPGPWDPSTTTNTPGSFGLLDVGAPAIDVPAFKSWFASGQTPNDITYLLNNNLLPVSLGSPKNWICGPVLNGTFQSSFFNEMGVPSLLPLFMPAQAPSTGSYQAATISGSIATYAVVGFAGAAISQADASGTSMVISLQPCAVVDPTAVIPNPKRVGLQNSQFGSSTIITTFISAKLTK